MQRNMLFLSALFLIFFSSCSQHEAASEHNQYTLWYTHPAVNWDEALPIGNGRLGAMIFGGPAEGRLQLNEETVWSGSPNNNIKPGMRKTIPVIRKLLFEKKYKEAQQIADTMMKDKPNNGMAYQPVGDLLINFPGHENFHDYRRSLDSQKRSLR
jgi:alpha-L-fucosidase 2